MLRNYWRKKSLPFGYPLWRRTITWMARSARIPNSRGYFCGLQTLSYSSQRIQDLEYLWQWTTSNSSLPGLNSTWDVSYWSTCKIYHSKNGLFLSMFSWIEDTDFYPIFNRIDDGSLNFSTASTAWNGLHKWMRRDWRVDVLTIHQWNTVFHWELISPCFFQQRQWS